MSGEPSGIQTDPRDEPSLETLEGLKSMIERGTEEDVIEILTTDLSLENVDAYLDSLKDKQIPPLDKSLVTFADLDNYEDNTRGEVMDNMGITINEEARNSRIRVYFIESEPYAFAAGLSVVEIPRETTVIKIEPLEVLFKNIESLKERWYGVRDKRVDLKLVGPGPKTLPKKRNLP
jgi:hypothetical protein